MQRQWALENTKQCCMAILRTIIHHKYNLTILFKSCGLDQFTLTQYFVELYGFNQTKFERFPNTPDLMYRAKWFRERRLCQNRVNSQSLQQWFPTGSRKLFSAVPGTGFQDLLIYFSFLHTSFRPAARGLPACARLWLQRSTPAFARRDWKALSN